MLQVLLALALSVLWFAPVAFTADLPWVPSKVVKLHVVANKATVAVQKPTHLIPVAVLPKVIPGSISEIFKEQTQIAIASTNVSPDLIELPWVLDPLVATADGGKKEGSSGVEGNLVTNRPGTNFGPDVVIELTGHVIKTAQSTVRLDIHIGSLQKSILWAADDVKSGVFKITLNEKLQSGQMPSYFPASAMAFVTQEGEGHVAMVSLEKIVFRMGVSATPQ